MSDKCPGCGAKGKRIEAPEVCNLSVASPRAKFDCGTVLYDKGVWLRSITCHQNQIETLKGEVERYKAVVEAARAYWDWVAHGKPYSNDNFIRCEPHFDDEKATRYRQYRHDYYNRSMAIGKALTELEAEEMWEEVDE